MGDTPNTALQEKSTAAAAILPGAPVAERGSERGSRLLALVEKLNDPEKTTSVLKALIDAETQRELFEMDQRHARVFALSGEFNDIKGESMEQSIAKAMAKIQLGRNWGFSAADSMKHVYFTNGRPAIENAVVADALQRAGYGWDIDFHEVEVPGKNGGPPSKLSMGCTLYLKTYNRQQKAWLPMLDHLGKQIEVSFMKADADRALVYVGNKQIPLSEKFNYQSWAGDMYYWRAISRVKKFYAPAVLRGALAAEQHVDDETEAEIVPQIATANAGGPGLPPGPTPTLTDIVTDGLPFEDEPKG